MSPVRITFRRTIGLSRNVYSTALVVGVFLAAVASYFAFNLNAAEGERLSVAVVWASSVAPILPLLAAFLGMDVWSEERRLGRLDILLASPVSEWDLTLGKFLGVWLLTILSTALSLVASVFLLKLYAPLYDIAVLPLLAAFAALVLQGALWCAVSVACSAVFRQAAVSAVMTVAVLVALPRGIWAALLAWSSKGRAAYGEFPLDAHAIDVASGLVSSGTVIVYLILIALALYWAVAFVSAVRLVGRGARSARIRTFSSVVLATVLATLLSMLVVRLDVGLYLPVSGETRFSERTIGILSDAHGDVTASCFLPRSDVRFRSVARLLRAFARESQSRGGVRLTVRFVDPAWDLGEAARLVRSGVKPGEIHFTYGRRTAILPIDDALGERLCASTILRLTMPPQRRVVRWTCGHGESTFDDYGPFGMSDIARELSRDGYLNQSIDLSSSTRIPSDCALIVIAGLREDFSRVEIARLDAYLKQGGRLMVLLDNVETGGIASLLSGWGVNVVPLRDRARTVSGSDAIVSGFSDHPVTHPLKGTNLLLEKPVAFQSSAAVGASGSLGRIDFTPLAKTGQDTVAASIERGAEVGEDLDFRPTRIIAVGDSSFVMNAPMAAQANANRDFFLNAAAYLSGTDALTPGGMDGDRLVTGMDRAARRRYVVFNAAVFPACLALALALVAFRRSRRS